MSVDSQSSTPDSPSLDSNCDNPTRWEKRLSVPDATVDDSAGSDAEENWDRQQKRVFHRVNTLLHYWESRDYEIVWLTLTSSPGSDDADQLAYNLQRLRQTVERARLARDGDGDGHDLRHVDQLEQLCIRTSEGPEGKGVLHLFWAWDPETAPLSGRHGKGLYIPQDWLAHQWGRIHGPESGAGGVDRTRAALSEMGLGPACDDIEPLYVWIEKYGEEDYHDRTHVARYCVTQYLGEHAEALEHVSWSHGRTLGGGSLVEAWEAVRDHREKLEEAVEAWETVIAGESVSLDGTGDYVDYGIEVHPPPNLGVEVVEEPTLTPPDDYHKQGPDTHTLRTVTRQYAEYDGTTECPECGQGGVFELSGGYTGDLHPEAHSDRVAAFCVSCETPLAEPGDAAPEVVEKELPAWECDVDTTRQTGLWEFDGFSRCVVPASEPAEASAAPTGGTVLSKMSREARAEPPEELRANGSDRTRAKRYVENHPDADAVAVAARAGVPPRVAEGVVSE